MSDTIWVAIITALATTVPQIINSIITYRKDIKQKQLDFFEKNRLNAIVEFLDTVGETYSREGLSQIEKYKFDKSLNKLLLYFPNIDNEEVTKISNSTKEWDSVKRLDALNPLINKLSKSISEK